MPYEDSNTIHVIIEEIEKYAILTKDESFLEMNNLPPSSYVTDFENTLICDFCNIEYIGEDVITTIENGVKKNICFDCNQKKYKSTDNSKYNQPARANPKDAFDSDEQYIDWYENQ